MTGRAAGKGRRFVIGLPLALFVVLAVFFYVRLYAGDPSQVPSALIGKSVPEFSLPPLEGLRRLGVDIPGLSHNDLKGKVSIVNVWASWCVPCRDEHPLLVELVKRGNVNLVGINYKDRPEQALQFLDSLGNPFLAVGVDANGRAAIDWGVYGVPETFVVGEDGTVLYKHIGPLTEVSLRAKILPFLEKSEDRLPQ
jgi:cytochrome c biogenesis protein CcmG, thiol:disulfide interchange protein DsbE